MSDDVQDPAQAASSRDWSTVKKAVFPFLFVYALLYTFPFPINRLLSLGWSITGKVYEEPAERPAALTKTLTTLGEWLEKADTAMTSHTVPKLGEWVFGPDGKIAEIPMNGSGDATWNWLVALQTALAAAAIGFLWAVIGRKSRGYPKLATVLERGVRWYLLLVMFDYGFAKVIPTQFPPPRLDRMAMTYAESSPMGLAWRFMGYSSAYCIFSGLGEVLAGFFLVFRRTAGLGAILAIAVMLNVVMINFCFDVPVKLFSSHLLAMGIVLALADARRFVDFLVLNRTVSPRPLAPIFGSKACDIATTILKIAVVGFISWSSIDGALRQKTAFEERHFKSPVRGIHDVLTFEKDGVAIAPHMDEKDRWKKVVFDFQGLAFLRTMDDRIFIMGAWAEIGRETLELTPPMKFPEPGEPFPVRPGMRPTTGAASRPATADSNPTTMPESGPTAESSPSAEPRDGVFRITEEKPGILRLDGRLDGHTYRIVLSARDPGEQLLPNRGFHWINERPFHR